MIYPYKEIIIIAPFKILSVFFLEEFQTCMGSRLFETLLELIIITNFKILLILISLTLFYNVIDIK